MDENRVVGAVKKGTGRAKAAAGALTGDAAMEAKGKLNETTGSAQNFYGRAVDHVRGHVQTTGDFITEQPLAAAAVATVVGLALGLLLGTAL